MDTIIVGKKTTNIPAEFKCSRCKKDLRDEAENPCVCLKSHTINGNKSGGQFIRTIMDYQGGRD